MRDLETIVAQNAKRLTRAPQGISPYLLRPLRTLEQALSDRKTPLNPQYIKTAQAQYQKDGEIEIDNNAPVSHGGELGSYVQAWVFVYDEDI